MANVLNFPKAGSPMVPKTMLPAGQTAGLPDLRVGSTGTQVADLQRRLNAFADANGTEFAAGATDGTFTEDTARAVVAYKTLRQIRPFDGTVDPGTWARLVADTANYIAQAQAGGNLYYNAQNDASNVEANPPESPPSLMDKFQALETWQKILLVAGGLLAASFLAGLISTALKGVTLEGLRASDKKKSRKCSFIPPSEEVLEGEGVPMVEG